MRDGTCHSRTVPSPEPEARIFPSGEKDTDRTSLSWPSRVAIWVRVAMSHNRTALPLREAVARVFPSGEYDIEMPKPQLSTIPVRAAEVRLPVARSNRCSIPLPETKIKVLPSGDGTRYGNIRVSNVNVFVFVADATSHSLKSVYPLDIPPEASVAPSEEKDNEITRPAGRRAATSRSSTV